MNNLEIAELLRAVASAYQIKNEKQNRFKIIAYERAADAVEHLSSEAKDLWDDGKLKDIPGVGESIAKYLSDIFLHGGSKHIDSILSGIPQSVFELLPIEGVGPKTAMKLVKELKISTPHAVDKLLKNAKQRKIEKIEGFGKDSQEAIIKSIKEIKGREVRLLLPYAQSLANEIISWLKQNQDVIRVDALGSLRRKASTVGDIDISASTQKPLEVIKHFTNYPKKSRVLEKGIRTASIIVPGNRQVDLMVENPSAYGALLQHFTGSKHHNIALRELALKHNLSLSDYGIYEKKEGKKVLRKIKTEKELYNTLNMDFIPPELREDSGEINAALKHNLPKLVELSDIKSDLQIHSDFDIETSHDLGETSMKDLVLRADKLGYEYIAFTEHNPSQRGHSEKDMINLLLRKKEVIDKLNYSLKLMNLNSVKNVFNSLEIDILPSAKLPTTDKALEILDFALVSIHSSFRQSKERMTKRILDAMSHPKIKIFAHPTARKINEREGINLDWDMIFDFCLKHNKWLEINCDPMRFDLPDYLVKEAIKNGVKLTLGTDAHHENHMENMQYGVYVARRGWAEKKDIINTYNLDQFKKMIQ